MTVTRSTTGIAYDRAGPPGDLPLVLVHAGIADRRMWDPQWPELVEAHDTVRLDLRGFGDSTQRPAGVLSPVRDLLDTLAGLRIGRCHLVGASFGAGVAVEAALTAPELVASLLLAAPGGSLIPAPTEDLRAFAAAENAALARGDLDAAVDANLTWWVDGLRRDPDAVDPAVRQAVRLMQRRAFEVTADWDDVDEADQHPPALTRLAEVRAPALVLVGAHDLDAVRRAADLVAEGVPGARRVDWPDVAHLPSMERPGDFVALLEEWVSVAGAVSG